MLPDRRGSGARGCRFFQIFGKKFFSAAYEIDISVVAAGFLCRLFAQIPVADSTFLRDNYTKREVMIPMRDGIRLFTSIYTPKAGDDFHHNGAFMVMDAFGF